MIRLSLHILYLYHNNCVCSLGTDSIISIHCSLFDASIVPCTSLLALIIICVPVIKFVKAIIARTWKQPRCPSADEWIRKLWYIYTMEYYSAVKKNTFESVLMRWMKLEPIIQSEVSQKEKHQYSILTHIYGI